MRIERLWTSAPARRWGLTIGLAVLLGAGAAAALWQLRQDAIDHQGRELSLLSLALTDELERDLAGAEDSLLVMRNELAQHPGSPADDATGRMLKDRADLLPLIDRLWLLDAQGQPVAAAQPEVPPALAAFAPAPSQLGDEGIAVSRPFGAAGQEPRIALLRRVPTGWLVAALPVRTLLGAFGTAAPPDVRMAVLRSDGVRLAGTAVAPPHLDEARVARRLAVQPSLHVHRFRDGTDRLVSLRHLQHHGLEVVLMRDLGTGLAAWRETAWATLLGWALLTTVLLLAVARVQRASQRQAAAQRALQAQRDRASRLEALGTLAGGVAHDFNNMLAALLGHAEIAHEMAPPGSALARHLDLVLQACERGKGLVERILSFGRGGAHACEVFALTPVVEEVLQLLAASLPPGVVIEPALQAPEGRLRGDPTQAFEATMNLCTNALQAMPAGGRMTVTLQHERLPTARVMSHSELPPGDYLRLSVADEGPGITPTVMERLFEPFFTTRAAQRGTGLGLAVVHGVVAELGGGIDVQSRPGAGACFTLYLPESHDPIALAPAPPTLDTPHGDLPILVVDDDPALVDLTRELLGSLGYPHEGCTDPASALQRLLAHPQRYALLITDEVMPGLTGTALTDALRAAGSQIPVLLVTGYGGAQLAERAHRAGITRLLAKPLRRHELELALAELLN